MEHPITTLFRPVLEKEGSVGVAYLIEHPVLTSPYYTQLLQQWAATLGPTDRVRAEQAIALKISTFDKMRTGVYHVSPPNLIKFGLNVAKGNWTLQYAQEVASSPAFFTELMYPVVTAACEMAEKVMIQDWRPAVTLMRIVFSALDARGKVIPENQGAMELTTVETWLAVACRACIDVPDGRLFRDAVARAEPFADVEDKSVPPAPILHRLGVLHLDPYVAGKSNQNLAIQMEQWRQRLYQEYGSQLAGIPDEQLHLPPPEESLPKAVAFFRRAADRRTGEARGQTLKAMAQAMVWHEWFDLPVDAKELVAVASEALTLLPLGRFRAENAELNQAIQRFGERTDSKPSSEAVRRAREVLKTPVSDWLEGNNIVATIDIFHQNAIAVSNDEPQLAVDLFMAVDPLIRSQAESKRREHDHLLVMYAPRAFAPDTPKADGAPLDPKLQELFESARQQSWSEKRVIYSLVRLAASTTETNQEEEGLEALEYLYSLAKRNVPDPVLERVLPHLRALLQTGQAVNAFNSDEFGEAARRYLVALQLNLDANQPLLALDILRRMIHLATPDRPQSDAAMEALVAGLAENALQLELDAEEAATNLIQSTCRFAISALLANGPAKTTVLLFLLDAAKGRRFRAALTEPGAALDWLNAPHTLAAGKELAELSSLARAEKPETPSVLDQNMLLTAYVSASETHGGGSATEQLSNLQIKFDRQLDRQLSIGADDQWLPTIENLQSLLDDKVVLAIQYLGMASDGSLTLLTMLVTSDDSVAAEAVLPGIPSSQIVMSVEEQSVAATPLSLLISKLRDEIVSPPGPFAVDSQAQETLESDYPMFFGGPLEAKLKQWRAAGKDHLCFCPHGPFHFYPFHLLGPEEQPLANDWCVTYLPHPLLLKREGASESKRLELTSVGLNFAGDNEFGLGELMESEGEAQAVAAVYAPHSKLLNGSDATEKAVLQTLLESRRVHISTHGLHNVSAPAFQCIFVQPDATEDGIIHAYELLRLDLRGLDLVTFSACETALGRFDIADNLRGIPAALLVAGVSTIIGTLWNVETETATYFFTQFYSVLKATDSKKTAFYKAQNATRSAFPKYRDWGAFQFIGSW